jgi:hypothetical protein
LLLADGDFCNLIQLPRSDTIRLPLKRDMALSGFEVAIGGITSIPVISGLIFLSYKSFGENSLDTSKLKPKNKSAARKETSTSEKKSPATKSETSKNNTKTHETIKELTMTTKQSTPKKEEIPTSSEKQPKTETTTPTLD